MRGIEVRIDHIVTGHRPFAEIVNHAADARLRAQVADITGRQRAGIHNQDVVGKVSRHADFEPVTVIAHQRSAVIIAEKDPGLNPLGAESINQGKRAAHPPEAGMPPTVNDDGCPDQFPAPQVAPRRP